VVLKIFIGIWVVAVIAVCRMSDEQNKQMQAAMFCVIAFAIGCVVFCR
jgi:hypothetical protein